MNTFGERLRLTTFGESHGPAIGGILDGVPPGLAVDRSLLRSFMLARRPGNGANVSQRKEEDEVEILSGLSADDITLGTPIGFIIRNNDTRSGDYEQLRHVYRPNHGDYTWQAKYGIRDHRGGGRASARETAVRVAAAGIIANILISKGIDVQAQLTSIGEVTDTTRWDTLLQEVRAAEDSIGGTVSCVISGLPAGLGEPVFGKLQARLAAAMLSIPGVKGFEYGLGFEAARMRGSECADIFTTDDDGHISTITNYSGGIQGGISNGMPVTMNIAFKPTPSIGRPLQTVDDTGHPVTLSTHGRHDPCIAVRGVAVVRAMAILTIADALLLAHTDLFLR